MRPVSRTGQSPISLFRKCRRIRLISIPNNSVAGCRLSIKWSHKSISKREQWIAVDCVLSLAAHTRLCGPANSDQSNPQFFTGAPNDASIKNLARAAQRHLGLPPLTMHRHVHLACAALLLVRVKAATVLGQPFPKRRAFHRLSLRFPTPLLGGPGFAEAARRLVAKNFWVRRVNSFATFKRPLPPERAPTVL
jgi:hypothetical protein